MPVEKSPRGIAELGASVAQRWHATSFKLKAGRGARPGDQSRMAPAHYAQFACQSTLPLRRTSHPAGPLQWQSGRAGGDFKVGHVCSRFRPAMAWRERRHPAYAVDWVAMLRLAAAPILLVGKPPLGPAVRRALALRMKGGTSCSSVGTGHRSSQQPRDICRSGLGCTVKNTVSSYRVASSGRVGKQSDAHSLCVARANAEMFVVADNVLLAPGSAGALRGRCRARHSRVNVVRPTRDGLHV